MSGCEDESGREPRLLLVKDRRLQQIRNRASYLLFRQLYEFLKQKPRVADILRKFHDILDAKRAFGSERNAEYAAESLDRVLRDNGVNQP